MTNDIEILDSYGGATEVAKLLGYDIKNGGVQRVQNWYSRGIPSDVKLEHPEIFLTNLIEKLNKK